MPHQPTNLLDLYYGPAKLDNNSNLLPKTTKILRNQHFNLRRFLLINNNTALYKNTPYGNYTTTLSGETHPIPKITVTGTENGAYLKYRKQLCTRQQRIHKIWKNYHSILYEPREDGHLRKFHSPKHFDTYRPTDSIQQVRDDYQRNDASQNLNNSLNLESNESRMKKARRSSQTQSQTMYEIISALIKFKVKSNKWTLTVSFITRVKYLDPPATLTLDSNWTLRR